MKKYRITIDVDVNKDGKFVSDLNHAMYQGLRPLLIDALGAWLDGYKFKVEPFEQTEKDLMAKVEEFMVNKDPLLGHLVFMDFKKYIAE